MTQLDQCATHPSYLLLTLKLLVPRLRSCPEYTPLHGMLSMLNNVVDCIP